MLLKISFGLVAVIGLFLVYVATQNGKFRYERSGLINAPPEVIFPYLSDLRRGSEWSPYEQRDPNMKKNFIGSGSDVGSVMEFDGNKDAGAGKLELMKSVPHDTVEYKLTMTRPIYAENLVEYKLKVEGAATRFYWIMSGDGGFLGKLIGVLIDCEKMVAGDFSKGIENLKHVIESKPK